MINLYSALLYLSVDWFGLLKYSFANFGYQDELHDHDEADENASSRIIEENETQKMLSK